MCLKGHIKCAARVDQNPLLAAVVRPCPTSGWLVNHRGLAALFPRGLCRGEVKVAGALGSVASKPRVC